jgi:hypothetical protein
MSLADWIFNGDKWYDDVAFLYNRNFEVLSFDEVSLKIYFTFLVVSTQKFDKI